MEIKNLENKSRELRRKVLDLALETEGGHIGGSFSEIEILLALYDKVLKDEDKFILSKGHACYPLYLLLREKDYNPKIQGHPDIDEANGIHATTGSLGHGLPIAAGMAFTRKKLEKQGRLYVLISDGECQEGTTWETAQIAAHHKLDNLTVIVDNNKLQALQPINEVQSLGDLNKKFQAFGWYTSEIDGHDFSQLIPALYKRPKDKPHIIIAHTIKGKGVSYMEGNPDWHGRHPTPERLAGAYGELGGSE